MNVPKIRFKEFSDEWRKINLKDISIINPKNEQLPNEFIYIDLESVNKGILSQEKIISKTDAPSRAQRTVKKNDILFQMVRPYQQNNYFIKEIKEIPYVASTGYALIRTSEDPYFIYSILHKKDFLDRVIDRCTGTSFPAINANDLGDININIPSIQEQNKVSSFLSLLQTKKIEDLKLFKLCMMKEIFTSNSASNLTKIKDIAIIEKGKQINGDLLLEYGNYYMLNGGINPSGYLNEYNRNENTITISEGGNSCGYVNINKEKFWCGGHCYSAAPNNINNDYLYQILKYNEKAIMELRVGSGLPNIQKKDIENFNLKIHNKEEQENIALKLSKFDYKITLEEKYLSKLHDLKKGLMQNMFV